MEAPRSWQVWIDTGGTFTDGVGIDPEGRLQRVKILSTSALRGTVARHAGPARIQIGQTWNLPPDFICGFRFRLLGRPHPELTVRRYDPAASLLDLSDPLPEPTEPGTPFEVISVEEAPVLAARLLTRTPPGRPLPAMAMRLATTLGTNALLERRGVRVALFITRGFGDLLRIGTQQRPDLFALEIRRPDALYEAAVEVPERMAADGTVLEPLDVVQAESEAARLVRTGVQAAAVALLHSYRNPRHEEILKEILLRSGLRQVSCSSEVAPFIKILPRAETAVVDAYLAPILRDYLDGVRSRFASGRLHVMTSAGGLMSPEAIRPKDCLLSGPAGGVVGAAAAGKRSGYDKVIVFDMGGTSTDVARFDGDYEYAFEQQVGEAHLVAPALAIESVAAGGGSLCWFDGDRLRVGPQSAGANPGPACYGAGGPLTLTDVNLLLGRLEAERFEIPIRTEAAAARLEELRTSMRKRTGESADREALLSGFLEIADERMADAIRCVSLRRGYDPAAYALVAFGGAGGQHACGVARCLGIPTILVPRDAGLLSALGLGHAVIERFAERQLLRPLEDLEKDEIVERTVRDLARQASEAVRAEVVPADSIVIRRRVAQLRFAGQDSTVEVACDGQVPLRRAFEERYTELFGHRPEGRSVELESLRVVASSIVPPPAEKTAGVQPFEVEAQRTRRTFLGGAWRDLTVFERERLGPGSRFEGPALIFERHGATVVDAGWRVQADGTGALVLQRAGRSHGEAPQARPEAVRLELFSNRLRTIATEMGERLRRTAISTNVKERLDFSCAILDPQADLVVNAPHIPVHLGSLGLCVRLLREAVPLEPGDVIATNHPAYGGSHLPDVTVVTPVFSDGSAMEPATAPTLLGYVASRAHHAEIGGTRPGSMPPAARTLVEEGVVIDPIYLVRRGEARWQEVRRLLEEAPFPTRALEDNLADLRAAVAANHAGAVALRAMALEHGAEATRRSMEALKGISERRIRAALDAVPDGTYEAVESLDDGSPLRATIRVEGDRASIDFSGSSAVHPGNLNATPAIVRSVVMYVLRLHLREPLPLNDGLLRPVTIRIPAGILDPGFPRDPRRCPAIVGGNVETSQRLVDTLLKALGLAACSQGTMNNVLFGNERFGYYETLCGGCGAGPGFHGASAVHSHMTNTRITDPEIIEHRYPVRVNRFAVRAGSGGQGKFRGGDGVVREYTFLAPLSLSILSQHRTVRPYGLAGGAPGEPGAQRVVRSTGEIEILGPVDSCEVGPGDRLVIETPGGGGYGSPGGEE